MSIKINTLEIENVKRIKAVKLQPTADGLTVIGGGNGQGKTSVLDAIAWALGGDRYRPSDATREGSVIPPYLRVTLSNGIVVERKGKNSDLRVTDPQGQKSGQQLLNAFVSTFALDLPKFLNAGSKAKADILLQILGVGEKLHELERRETELYNRRHAVGQIADQKAKYAREMTVYPDAPKEPVSAMELISQQQEILRRNGENAHKRRRLAEIEQDHRHVTQRVEALQRELADAMQKQDTLVADLEIARKAVETLQDESTEELERSIENVERINVMVRANLDKEKAEEEAAEMYRQYETLTTELEDTRKKKRDLLEGADLPLPGLTVENGELLYGGRRWDCMSGAEQLRVGTAIVRKLNPQCGFVLLDKLEQMDADTLTAFGRWIEQEGLQAIATRVSKGDECSVIISDGCIQPKQWKAGEF